MPIRFRCPHCNQLLGISRRKAGTQVSCPTCQAKVTVPGTPAEGAAVPGTAPARAAPIFEHSDFDALLRAPAPPPLPAAPEPAAAAPGSAFEVEILDPATLVAQPARPGLFLSPVQATLLTIAAIVLLALAFVAGALVGRFAF